MPATLDDVINRFDGMRSLVSVVGANLYDAVTQVRDSVNGLRSLTSVVGSSLYTAVTDMQKALGSTPAPSAPSAPSKPPASPGLAAAIGGAIGGAVGASASSGGNSGPLDSFSAAVGSVTSVMDGLLGSMGGFVSAITSTAGAMTQFVSALSPGLMQQFNYAVDTLDATLGAALLPAFEVLVGLIQNVAGQIDPLMHALAPILEQFAQVIASLVVPIVIRMVSVLELLTPVFQLVLDVLQAVIPVFTAFEAVVTALIRTVADLLAGFLGGDGMKGALQSLKHAMEEVAKFLLLAAARISAMFGDTGQKGGVIDNIRKTVDDMIKPAANGEAPAPKNAGMASLESIGKSIAEASFLAGGTQGEDKTDNQWLRDISESLKDLKTDNLGSIIGASVEQVLEIWWKAEWAKMQAWAGSFWPWHGTAPGGKDTNNR